MDHDVEDTKETYAHFGLAIYWCQILEHGIVNAMVILRLPRRDRIVRTEIDAFYDQQFKKTLGGLINGLRAETALPNDLEDLLTRALTMRNWLCHHYFRERAIQIMTPAGRLGMIEELEAAWALLKSADDSLTAAVQPIAERYGFTEARFKEVSDVMMRENGVSDPSTV